MRAAGGPPPIGGEEGEQEGGQSRSRSRSRSRRGGVEKEEEG